MWRTTASGLETISAARALRSRGLKVWCSGVLDGKGRRAIASSILEKLVILIDSLARSKGNASLYYRWYVGRPVVLWKLLGHSSILPRWHWRLDSFTLPSFSHISRVVRSERGEAHGFTRLCYKMHVRRRPTRVWERQKPHVCRPLAAQVRCRMIGSLRYLSRWQLPTSLLWFD